MPSSYKNLLNFETYDDYLDSFTTIKDTRYLITKKVARTLIQSACGVACIGGMLNEGDFEKAKHEQFRMMRPLIGSLDLFSDHCKSTDEVVMEFAKREWLTRSKMLSCIVFLCVRSQAGFEVSAYIDLGDSFLSATNISDNATDWKSIFEGKAALYPQKYHLSYCDWKHNQVVYNDSENFRNFNEGSHSLLFMHRGDHKKICVNAGCECKNSLNARRSMHYSPKYGYVIFFDHIVRRKH